MDGDGSDVGRGEDHLMAVADLLGGFNNRPNKTHHEHQAVVPPLFPGKREVHEEDRYVVGCDIV